MNQWLENKRKQRAAALAKQYPAVTPGMFVQLTGWFGDVWAEIISAYCSADDPVWHSVTFYRYEKGGLTRQLGHAYYGDIREFARREDIDVPRSIVYTPNMYSSFGEVVVTWPTEQRFLVRNGYAVHPSRQFETSICLSG